MLAAIQFKISVFLSVLYKIKTKMYKSVILPVVLYGCETWSFYLREGHKLRVFENRMLRKVFGPKREEVAGSWRRLHNEGCGFVICMLHIKSRRIRWAGHVTCMGEMRNAYKILVRKPQRRRLLGRPRHR
jgi:hypothetical protein